MLNYLPAITPRFASRAALNVLRRGSCDAFEQKLTRAGDVQRDWLLNRIRLGRETQFGRDHGFENISTIEEFRKQVPVSGYERFAPYIDRVAAGETDTLVPPSEKLLQFTITT